MPTMKVWLFGFECNQGKKAGAVVIGLTPNFAIVKRDYSKVREFYSLRTGERYPDRETTDSGEALNWRISSRTLHNIKRDMVKG